MPRKHFRRQEDYYYLKLETHYLPVEYYGDQRRVRVLLPKDYTSETASYPVLYMLDGQNVFYSKEAFAGYSWKVIPTIKNNPDLPKLIIVAIDNAGENRLNEYGPWPSQTNQFNHDKQWGGDGYLYSDWLVDLVKPFIDAHYRTKADRLNTFLAGSSMGGIMTAFIGAHHPEVFGGLGVFSLASWFSSHAFNQFIGHTHLFADTKVYIQVGTQEGDDTDAQFIEGSMKQAYIDASITYYNTLLRNGHSLDKLWLRILADERHNELYWAKHFPEFLYYLFE